MKLPWRYRFGVYWCKSFVNIRLGVILVCLKFRHEDIPCCHTGKETGLVVGWIPFDVKPGESVPIILNLVKKHKEIQVET